MAKKQVDLTGVNQYTDVWLVKVCTLTQSLGKHHRDDSPLPKLWR